MCSCKSSSVAYNNAKFKLVDLMSRRNRGRWRSGNSSSSVEQKALTPSTFPSDLLFSPSLSGVAVSPETALEVPAVAAAVSLISGAVGSLPLSIFKEEGAGRVPATDHSGYEIVTDAANEWTSSSELRTQLAQDALLHGNGYGLVRRLPNGEVFEILRLMPGSVITFYDPANGRPTYRWNPVPGASTLGVAAQAMPTSGAEPQDFSHLDIIHIRSPLRPNGIVGVSPIQHAREAIALALVMEQYASRLFGNGARPGGVIEIPHGVSDDAKARMKASWQANHGGSNSGGTAILEAGTKFEQIALSSVDAEFSTMRNFAVVEIARAFNISPALIGDLSRATWSNLESSNTQFLQSTLQPWLKSFESAYSRTILDPSERKSFSIEFDTTELLRGDTAARGEFLAKMRSNGIFTANECRAYESLPAHRSGDTLESPHVQSGGTKPQDQASQ